MLRALQDMLVGLRDRPRLTGLFHVAAGRSTPTPLVPRSSRSPRGPHTGVPRPTSLREAIQWTVAYSSIFDFPLTREEVHRFLIDPGGSPEDVDAAIDDALSHSTILETNGLFLYPAGHSGLVATRLRRGKHAGEVWRYARLYAWLVWTLPYVRMVAVTGSLAMDNVESGDDIDLMIVTEPGRLWMTRAMILLVARFARIRGHVLCPNYIVSSSALSLPHRDAYAAHELVQMAPIYGRQVAQRLWTENAWCREYLPNARWRSDRTSDDSLPWMLMASKAAAEFFLGSPLGTRIERWEQRRKIARLVRGVPDCARETVYTADVCKGHVDSHGSKVMNLWMEQAERQIDHDDR